MRLEHEPLHSLDEVAEVVVELLDRPRLHLQSGIWVLADLREGQATSRLALGVEVLLLDDLTFDLGHLQWAH